ncbi:uncharacterized protein AMSG_09245 [Thecamonas trahens ATCC 50062]|uniref:Uncharacterized protein n=1 Tax=Thecamonas trahens ATCC 50062 TaxID=461836 RepID=A0A0L0DMC5_THETB|nr:hypothetical protein AMSG_09245 [Thecamonas trahens ATCC 50062]KNC53166.1 hypothetical protein AMSG_09245 [Thecamonas trahens ATCC 50062]|eukprot:XP_013754639.1 hypothetical protein AMSG_09245 [Thecamonas trahens ATCC 50062]
MVNPGEPPSPTKPSPEGKHRSSRLATGSPKFRSKRRDDGAASSDSASSSSAATGRPKVPARSRAPSISFSGDEGGGSSASGMPRARGWSALEDDLGAIEAGVAVVQAKRAAMAPPPPPTSARASRAISPAFIADLDTQLSVGCAPPSPDAALLASRALLADLLDDAAGDDEFLDMTDPSSFDFTSDDEGSLLGLDTDWSGIGHELNISATSPLVLSSDDAESQHGPVPHLASDADAYEALLHEVPLPAEADPKGVLDLVTAFADFAAWPNANSAITEEFGKIPRDLQSLHGLKGALEDNEECLPPELEPQLAAFLADVAFRTPADVAAWRAEQGLAPSASPPRRRRASSILRSSIVTSLHRYIGAFQAASKALDVHARTASLASVRDLLKVVVEAINGAAACLVELDHPEMMTADELKAPAAALLRAARPLFDAADDYHAVTPPFTAAHAQLKAVVANLVEEANTWYAVDSLAVSTLALARDDLSPHSQRLIDTERITRVRLLSSSKAALVTV